jgi:hypothetical protein
VCQGGGVSAQLVERPRIIAPSALRLVSASSPFSSMVPCTWSSNSVGGSDPRFLEPGARAVGHERENSGARITAAESRRKPERAQVGLLHDCLGFCINLIFDRETNIKRRHGTCHVCRHQGNRDRALPLWCSVFGTALRCKRNRYRSRI